MYQMVNLGYNIVNHSYNMVKDVTSKKNIVRVLKYFANIDNNHINNSNDYRAMNIFNNLILKIEYILPSVTSKISSHIYKNHQIHKYSYKRDNISIPYPCAYLFITNTYLQYTIFNGNNTMKLYNQFTLIPYQNTDRILSFYNSCIDYKNKYNQKPQDNNRRELSKNKMLLSKSKKILNIANNKGLIIKRKNIASTIINSMITLHKLHKLR